MRGIMIAATLAGVALTLANDGAAAIKSASSSDIAAQLWKYEQEIYLKRGQGDLSYYLSLAHPDYTVWAPGWPKPNGHAELVKAVADLKGRTRGEVITPTLKHIEVDRSGSVAMVYYSTHRTRTADGKIVDDRFDTLHVWVREKDRWLMLGGMARPQS